ncbi:MAG: Vitamin K epoxide reductase family protein [Deltaproteobacteria bacterium ADurb.Bin207]|nr:MAG: Vitamin K epoxide reductase family protein [Deltaproteobacteria bacterium ADurb.Bin207]
MWKLSRMPIILALVASALGLIFAGFSTYDYIQHLDRQLHAVHCSFTPGLAEATDTENACRTAMYSVYGALFRGTWWGGVPVSLFALGVYVFFAAFAVAMLVGGANVSKRAYQFLGFSSLGPLLVSVIMAFIAAVRLGVFCKTCVGLYVASALLAAAGIWGMVQLRKLSFLDAFSTSPPTSPAGGPPPPSPSPPHEPVRPMPPGNPGAIVLWLASLGLGVPAIIYVNALPDFRPLLASCGTIPQPKSKALVSLATTSPKRDMIIVADPLCPTCKGLHERLKGEGAMENINASLVLMPLDSTCNWMLDRSLHPGSCILSKAVICADPRSRDALEWMYRNQEELASLGKAGDSLLRARLRTHFGEAIDTCIDAKQTAVRLNNILQYAVTNELPVSTPQLYLGDLRICDEDSDLGLRFTLAQLAPEVLP